MSKIKFLVMDIDGTLTDGKIYMGPDGEVFKAFDIKDGCGIYLILPKLDIIPVIITARKSEIVERRCEELNIREVHQDSNDKLATLNKILDRYNSNLGSVAYIGDDLPDLPCMDAVNKAGGLALCPADAISDIRKISSFVSECKAGYGAVRDCIEYLYKHQQEIY